MKIGFVSVLTMVLLLIVTGCNQEKKPTNEKVESVFNKKDKEKTIEMIEALNERLEMFETEINAAISKGEIAVGDNEVFTQKVNDKSEELVIRPFLKEVPGSLINGRGAMKVAFTPKSTDDCTFGNCNYDSIAVPTLQVNAEDLDIYNSEEFEITELTFSNVVLSYSTEQDSDSSYISFVKGESGDMYFSFNPIINSLNFNLKELDKEFLSIQSEVPESEVKTEEEAFKQEVEEVLAKYPPLQ